MPAPAPANEIHQPHAFDPMAYDFVGAFDNQPPPGSYLSREPSRTFEVKLWNDEVWEMEGLNYRHAYDSCLRAVIRDSATSVYNKGNRGHQCDHCGAHIRYVVVVKHRETGDYLAIGEQCADNRIGSMNAATWQVKQLREAAQRARQAERNRVARENRRTAWLAEDPARAQVITDLARLVEEQPNDRFYNSLQRYFDENGMLTGAQERAVVRAVEREQERAARAAAEAIEIVSPAPSGRVTVVGTILSIKEQDSDFGTVWKMLVKSDDGYKVWGTVPRSLWSEAANGVRFSDVVQTTTAWLLNKKVSFVAELQPKRDDVNFAYFKRPAQAKIVEGGN